jgi:hypothetical protein
MIPYIENLIQKLFPRSKNPHYKLLHRFLIASKTIKSYNKIYFLDGFEYTEDNYAKFKQTSNVKQFLGDVKYKAQKDNVNLYFIESDESDYLLTLFDSFEFYSGEQVLALSCPTSILVILKMN